MPIDPQSEQGRLTENYAGMTEIELGDLAAVGDTLTAVARQALRGEIAKRGLDIEVLERSPEEPPPPNLVTIRQFRDIPEALLAKGALDSAGIPSFLADTNIVRMDWFLSNAVGGVKLQVREKDAPEAKTILDQSPPESFEVEGVGSYEQPRCPNCQSLDIEHDPLNKDVAYGSLAGAALTGGIIPPIPLHNSGWTCQSCGHRWQDT